MESGSGTAMEEDGGQSTASASLFPFVVQPPSGAETGASKAPASASASTSQWLSNSSFTVDLSAVDELVSSRKSHTFPLEHTDSEEEERRARESSVAKPQPYGLVESSSSDGERDREKDKRKKKRRRPSSSRDASTSKTSRSAYSFDASSRKPNVSWASSDMAKDYYFDSRGDRDNLAFGSLYRMDVARYKLLSSVESNRLNSALSDTDVLDNKLKAGGRYCSAKYAALERHKNLKRIRIIVPKKPLVTVFNDFIPLVDDEISGKVVEGGSLEKASVIEESWEDEVLRKTREFNKITREHPHDEKAWLAFAEFQDKVASRQPQKSARLQTLEKKISILEKAVELNPENEELLLPLLDAYRKRDSADVFIGRWEKILIQNPGSEKLWREFLRVGEFSRFKVSEMRKIYANAIRAFSAACTRLHRQAQQNVDGPSVDPSVVQHELCLVDIFLSLCRFEWQAGYQELATALFQGEIEYCLFCPSLLLTEQSKLRLFEHFWNSNGARVGEDGALGWSTWLEKEEEERQRLIHEELLKENDAGGWTGWSEPLSKSKDTSGNPEDITGDSVGLEELNDDEDLDTKSNEKEDDNDEALLKLLGIDIGADPSSEVKDATTWTRWSNEELLRDSEQWMPIRSSSGASRGDGTPDREDDEQLSRAILFEDIEENLFSLSSEEARLSLIFQFIEFFGGKISKWTCTNSSTWAQKILSLEAVPDYLLVNLRRVHDLITTAETESSGFTFDHIFSTSNDISVNTDMMKFLRNVILRCLTAFSSNHILEEAALVAEELFQTKMGTDSCSVTPCRSLAKNLIKSNRQDVLLCGVYARREAACGNIEYTRKVFDMALASVDGLSMDLQSNASLLYFWYAEAETRNGSGGDSESRSRAVHILSCFGCGVKYSPFKSHPSSLQQLKARQGFKERIRILRPMWARGKVDDKSIALICSAALFEELTTGSHAGIGILDEAFTMVLPERRRQSYQLELLFNFYVKMLSRHQGDLKLSEVWKSFVQGLQIYPSNPELYGALVETSHLHTSPNKLRWLLDNQCQKIPSVVVWLFALSFEISKGGSQHRIHGLFERALGNDELRNSAVLWRCYMAYEMDVACNPAAARRVFFRAIHACPWSKKLWLDGFRKLHSVMTTKELSDLQEVMRDKELNLRTDIYEILLLQDDEVQL